MEYMLRQRTIGRVSTSSIWHRYMLLSQRLERYPLDRHIVSDEATIPKSVVIAAREISSGPVVPKIAWEVAIEISFRRRWVGRGGVGLVAVDFGLEVPNSDKTSGGRLAFPPVCVCASMNTLLIFSILETRNNKVRRYNSFLSLMLPGTSKLPPVGRIAPFRWTPSAPLQ